MTLVLRNGKVLHAMQLLLSVAMSIVPFMNYHCQIQTSMGLYQALYRNSQICVF